jgi:hypothetical protein
MLSPSIATPAAGPVCHPEDEAVTSTIMIDVC